jgi:hypothetical protein
MPDFSTFGERTSTKLTKPGYAAGGDKENAGSGGPPARSTCFDVYHTLSIVSKPRTKHQLHAKM